MNNAPGAVDFLIAVALVLVTAAATVAALTRDPVRQAVALSALGLCLSLLFVVVQAPDVALSQLAVGSAVTPLLILLTVRKVRRLPRAERRPTAPERRPTAPDRRPTAPDRRPAAPDRRPAAPERPPGSGGDSA